MKGCNKEEPGGGSASVELLLFWQWTHCFKCGLERLYMQEYWIFKVPPFIENVLLDLKASAWTDQKLEHIRISQDAMLSGVLRF